ncbi:MAG: metal ABC transporter permease, partial [Litoreibacter sp.]
MNQNLREDGWQVVRKVSPYLWPDDKPWVKRRVVIALIFLLISKIVAVYTPFLFRGAVDGLTGDNPEAAWMLGMSAVALTIAYGVARAMNVGFQQLRDVVFAKVAQRALRSLALETFTHIH